MHPSVGQDHSEYWKWRKTLKRSCLSSSGCVNCTCRGIWAAVLRMDLSNTISTELGVCVCAGKRKERPQSKSQQRCFLLPPFVVFQWHWELNEDPLPGQTLVRVLNLLLGISVSTPPYKTPLFWEPSDVHKATLSIANHICHSPLMSNDIGLSLARISIGWIKQNLPRSWGWLLISFHLLTPFSIPSLARGNNLSLCEELRPFSCPHAKYYSRSSYPHLKVLNKDDLTMF